MSDGIYHTVGQGESLASIAEHYRFSWRALWNHPSNADLKRLRRNPNILLPGDSVFVPAKTAEEVSCATDRRHRFLRRGVPSRIQMRLLAHDVPRRNIRCVLDVDGSLSEVTTDNNGCLSIVVPPTARSARLRVGDGDGAQQFAIAVGNLNPITEISGVQGRLRNLGIRCPSSGQWDEGTQQAVRAFQAKHDLCQTGEMDEDTRNRLREVHGS